MSEDYDVGYAKPPKQHQYKKGQSGNPKGRPKGAKSVKTILEKELKTKIILKEQGKPLKVTKKEAIIKRLITDAVNGKAQAQNQLLKLIANHLVDASASDPFAQPLTEYDLKLLETYVSDVLDSKGDN